MASSHPSPAANVKIFRYSLATANVVYGALAISALLVSQLQSSFANYFHLSAILLTPYFALCALNQRVELRGGTLRYYDWLGRLKVEVAIHDVTEILFSSRESGGYYFRTLQGDIPFGRLKNWGGLVHLVADQTGLQIPNTLIPI